MLPGIDGFELCRSIRRTQRRPDRHGHRPRRHPRRRGRARGRRRRLPHQAVRAEGAVGPHPGPAAPGPARRQPGHARLVFGDLEIIPDEGKVAAAPAASCTSPRPSSGCCASWPRTRGGCSAARSLLDRVWGYGYFGDGRLVDVHVRRLRTKVEADPANPRHVVTVRGLGYRLQLTVSDGRARRFRLRAALRAVRRLGPATAPRILLIVRARRAAPCRSSSPAPPTASPARPSSASATTSAMRQAYQQRPHRPERAASPTATPAQRRARPPRRRSASAPADPVLPRRMDAAHRPSSVDGHAPRRSSDEVRRRRRAARMIAPCGGEPAARRRASRCRPSRPATSRSSRFGEVQSTLRQRRRRRCSAPPSSPPSLGVLLGVVGVAAAPCARSADAAQAAKAIAGGRLDTRLEPTDDPDLRAAVASSFNDMAAALQHARRARRPLRLRREPRAALAADDAVGVDRGAAGPPRRDARARRGRPRPARGRRRPLPGPGRGPARDLPLRRRRRAAAPRGPARRRVRAPGRRASAACPTRR